MEIYTEIRIDFCHLVTKCKNPAKDLPLRERQLFTFFKPLHKSVEPCAADITADKHAVADIQVYKDITAVLKALIVMDGVCLYLNRFTFIL